MRAVLQRVLSASVEIERQETRPIGPGLVVFLGVLKGDTPSLAKLLAEKIAGLRVFSDQDDKLNLSLSDTGAEVLAISNFTLGTDCRKGRRPSFDMAAPPEEARALGVRVTTGEFGAYMRVTAENDGPVTLILDTEKLGKRPMNT